MASFLPPQRQLSHISRRQPGWIPPSATAGKTALLILFAAAFFLALGSATAAEGQQQQRPLKATAAGASSHVSNSLCPRCPLCSRPGTPMKDWLKYCHTTTGYIFSLFSWGKSTLAGTQRTGGSIREQRQLYPLELPFATDDAVRRQCMRDLQDLLLARVRGQPQVVIPLLDVLRHKLAYPREPVVVHLAGDNGVGKSHTARLVSEALSLRCALDRDVCDAGDNLLIISGTGFDGLSVAEARQRIVGQIVAHVARYPHGVVLIDDLTAMDPVLVSVLAPLFGRASHFPEQLARSSSATAARVRHTTAKPLQTAHQWMKVFGRDGGRGSAKEGNDRKGEAAAGIDGAPPAASEMTSSLSRSGQPPPPPLSQLLVFITTDFGRQGRTVGKSRAEIEAMIQHDFADLYGSLLPAYTRTFVYFPFTQAMAEDVVRSAVTDLPCALGERLIASSTISDEAVAFLVQQHRQLWSGKENGHALRRLIEDEIVSQLVAYWETHEEQKAFERLRVRFELDEASMRVLLRTPHASTTTALPPSSALSSTEARAHVRDGVHNEGEEEPSDL
ncbi:conserved hypothetical protein [Leishmania braziliensis MHOM/BR/75/M2904]|uniref:AAA+ ATPase domain-containing protein n=2 Tax=Leishmania braziliensis TaxID=5660 RepID=A4H5R3_LEIBR|nr:conserved hypothetical protein [Leishmania braziliensis MHOM/BR/75/M2904]KAI5690720.1 hypothetical protein MNV84_01148 [Leishmania braziliensis]CAJ2467474.1 unnamed protein product [Leishmania braziliensis]CAJ2468057.1 unnamed protein product [Leishmania braziliensis]CAM41829.1 conserved hypothetical protein [Leishmania braziliensis MHOM/BR/75/M2904]SYZ63303.1 hypothetical_protein [Leishmania braziliensis MHOM/BR/75/M2904]